MISVLSETQERFFLAIGKQLPLDRVIEIHLFQPMRQGGIESGVAVVAAVPEGEPLVDEAIAGESLAAPPEGATCELPEPAGTDAALDAAQEASGSPGDDDEAEGEAEAEDEDEDEDERSGDDDSMDAEGQAAEDDTERSMDGVNESDEGELTLADEDDAGEAEVPRARRYTVYTAHYRHILKGPERGKWEVSVVAEADAPLLTVDVVVRGVLRRAGDAGEPERLSGDEMRAALRQTTAPAAPSGRR